MKKIISIIISAVMCISCLEFMPEVFPNVSIHASATITDSGICGENLRWVFSEGVLTISGIGEMENYLVLFYYHPWKYYESLIESVIIEKGVTSIGEQISLFMCNFAKK